MAIVPTCLDSTWLCKYSADLSNTGLTKQLGVAEDISELRTSLNVDY